MWPQRTPLILSGQRAPEESAAASPEHDDRAARSEPAARPRTGRGGSRFGPQQTYRIEVGRSHGVQPGNIVGAIANEADLDGSQINGIDIQDNHSFVRLPAGMPAETLERLQRVRVKGRALAAAVVEHAAGARHRKTRPQRGDGK